MPVSVVTDTTHYLPRDLVEATGIHEVSLYVTFAGEQRREADIDVDDFYARLSTADEMPTTSQPSVGDFLEVYTPLVQAGHDIVSIHLSGDISGTMASASQAAQEAMAADGSRRIEVVDSRSACGGLGAVVLAAVAAARGGLDVDGVAARARRAASRQKLWFALDTLEYLRRGGRIGAAQAWVGGALKIKPILTIDGTLTPIERVRTASRAFERMVDYLRSRKEDGATTWAVQHIQDPAMAERLEDAGREIFGTEPLFRGEIGPVIGAHAGPGLIGVLGMPPDLLEER
jgi:DegV family protein with EDD domain